MTKIDRRRFLAASAATLAASQAIERAWAIDAKVQTGTIQDVDHVVILMQENRSFDHYFGTMNGVRGFADRFPIPLSGGRTVWRQANPKGGPALVAPFPLDAAGTFAHMRVEGTPHNWADAQYAWDEGRMGRWPEHKHPHAMGHYVEADIPFQFALANAFTICDAYHCSFIGGTNTNRLFLWTGTIDGAGKSGGPSISNSHDSLPDKGGAKSAYQWTTYPERLEAAGISWRLYQDVADNFNDNPLVGFQAYRDSLAGTGNPALAQKAMTTQHLDALRADVAAGRLPQVSWVISPAKDSEHPGPSSPAQGADYTARVLDCLTANPEVWARTVFLVMFDENDGYFDHAPPPAPPSRDASGKMLGGSTVDVSGEYHTVRNPSEAVFERSDLMGRPYGLGPRVPMYVISPWSRGGWVNGEVFDHTSVIRFLEKRFGVMEPNISPWRRAVCGDLTTCFDFRTPNKDLATLPETGSSAQRAAALAGRTTPPTPPEPAAPVQANAIRRSRALPYALDVSAAMADASVRLALRNLGQAGAVLHIYDRLRPDDAPRRYTIEPGKAIEADWPTGPYDLWVLGPNGFHRHFTGAGAAPEPVVKLVAVGRKIQLRLSNPGSSPRKVTVRSAAYAAKLKPWSATVGGARSANHFWDLSSNGGWYDLDVRIDGVQGWRQRLAGRIENGQHGYSDPAMGGPAIVTSDQPA